MAEKKDETKKTGQQETETQELHTPENQPQIPEKSQMPENQPQTLPPSKAERDAAWLEEYVPIRLFKDSGRYADDVFVCVNGEACQIQRGVDVQIKRKFALVLANSRTQDEAAARVAAEFAAAGE